MKTSTLPTLLAVLTIIFAVGCGNSRIDQPDGAFHVTAFTPADGSAKVQADQTIRIRFNVAPEAGSVDATNIRVTADDTPVTGRLLVEGDTVTFVPAQLRHDTEYEVTVSGALLGSNGVALVSDVVATFETARRLRGDRTTHVDAAAQAPFKSSRYVYLTRQTEAVLLGADYNGSGKNLFVVDPVAFNPGDATAADEVMYSAAYTSLSSEIRKVAAAGNLDRDVYDEVVMVVQNGSAPGKIQWLNGANGEFDLRQCDFELAIPGVDGGAYRYELALGDLDGDGYDEIVVAAHHDSRSAYLWVFDDLRGGCPGEPTEKIIPGRDGGAIDDVQLAVGDFDGDGRADIAIANVRESLEVTHESPTDHGWSGSFPGLSIVMNRWRYETSLLIVTDLDEDLAAKEQPVMRSGSEEYGWYDDTYDFFLLEFLPYYSEAVTEPNQRMVAELRSGDLDGDGIAELLLTTRTTQLITIPELHPISGPAIDMLVGGCADLAELSVVRLAAGELVSGALVSRVADVDCHAPPASLWSVALDADGDRREEVLFDGELHKWNGSELVATGDEVDLEHVVDNEVQTVTRGDVNGDGLLDVMILRRSGSVAVYGMGRLKTHYDLSWQPVFSYSWSNFATLRSETSQANNDHQVLVAANVDDDSIILKPRLVNASDSEARTVEHRTVFSDDRIVAVLAAAPCHAETWQDSGRCRTSLARPTELKATADASMLVSARVMVSSEAHDATAFGSQEAGYLLAGKLADELTRNGRGHQTTDLEALFGRAATGADDLVVVYTVPYHRYTYTFASHPKAGLRGSHVYISLPLTPRVLSMSRTAYSASNGHGQAAAPGEAVLPHVPGEPSTYLGYDDIAESVSNHTDARTVRKDRMPTPMRLKLRRHGNAEDKISVDAVGERRLSCDGFGLGFSSGDGQHPAATVSFSSALVAQGSVGALHEASWDDHRYDFGMFSFMGSATNAAGAVTQQFLVVSYYVD